MNLHLSHYEDPADAVDTVAPGSTGRRLARRTTRPWVAIVPQKHLSGAKSRLDLSDETRRRFARAMLEDTLVALSGVVRLQLVLIAWEDPDDMRRMPRIQKVVNRVSAGGLNAAISAAEQELAERIPASNRVVVPGDLPACGRSEVADLLHHAERAQRSFLRDAEGSGTTILTALDNTGLSPRYGRRSAGHHLVSGAQPLDGNCFPSLRRDVDTLADLSAALRLGVGPATHSLARELGLVAHPANDDRQPSMIRSLTEARVQPRQQHVRQETA